ncbi:nuclease-related domain-containing protein [Pararhodospirillum photometricum]|uniref:nuclease-related domain-containing protein n=1 Tax=Pararhodospirillum photometricum TaxID=1084 RepID=UPI000686FE07|nr:nuclease-related domain-containing protein [Pararhodospirillum photometricum]
MLNAIKGATNQLRGALFEYMVADIVRRLNPGDVTMNRIFNVPDKGKAEIDVLIIQPNQRVFAIECKGYSPYGIIPDEQFKRWLQHNVPTAYAYICQHPEWKNLSAHFEFWTSAPISEDILALFNNAKEKIKPNRYTIDLLGPQDVLRVCGNTREKNLIEAYKNHFTPRNGSIPPLARQRPPARATAPVEED